jgi:hypothetical protein
MQMLIQTTATWLHYFCAFMGTCSLPQRESLDPSILVERVCPEHRDPGLEAPHVANANKALRATLVIAVSSDSSTADFQVAMATAVPLLQLLITNSADHNELMLQIGRLLSVASDEAEGDLRKSLSWLDVNSQALHEQVSQKMEPLQQRLVGLKAAVAQIYAVSAAEAHHWNKPFFEVRSISSTHAFSRP